MDKPCCTGVVRDSKDLKGETTELGGAPAYYTLPKGDAKNVGVVVVHDIFGFNIPNSKYICDHFASQGFPTVLPDLFANSPSSLPGWRADEFEILDPLEGDKFGSWFGEITSEAYWKAFHERVTACVEFLKTKGATNFCAVGFCWGGLAVEQLGQTGVFSQGASVHGCHSGPDGFTVAKEKGCTISYHTVPDDSFFTEEAQEKLKAAGAEVTSYAGMYHAFVVRGDYANNAELKEKAEQCLASVVAQFNKSSEPASAASGCTCS